MFYDPQTQDTLPEPREYLTLVKTFASTGEPMKYNYSFIPASDPLLDGYLVYYGKDVITYYNRVRINMNTLKVDPKDTIFTTSSGQLVYAINTNPLFLLSDPFDNLPFGSTGNCLPSGEEGSPGTANINFEGTSFKIDTTKVMNVIGLFHTDPKGGEETGGWDSSFANYNYTEKTIDLSGGGYPGFVGLVDSLQLIYEGLIKLTDVDQNENISAIPFQSDLSQNYPNPFNPTTKIKYQIPTGGIVSLKVYDVLGREVAALVNEEKPTGSYVVEFDASNLASGVYFYSLQTGNFIQTKKMILLR